MDTLVTLLWAIAPSLIVSIFMALWNRKQKQKDTSNEKRERERIEGDALRLSLLVATAQLSYAVAMAYKRGTPNGEMETGIEQYDAAMKQFRAFEREQMVKNMISER